MESIRGPLPFPVRPPAVRIVVAMIGLLLFTMSSTTSLAQSSYGRHFLIPFPDTSHVRTEIANPMPTEARLILIARERATVTVRAEGFEQTVTVTPDSTLTLSLYDPRYKPTRIFTDTAFLPVRRAIEVRSDLPIAVTAFFVTDDGSEAYTPLPVESWGREYMAMTVRNQLYVHVSGNEENLQIDNAPPQILIVAAEDATEVTVTPAAGSLGYGGGSYTLNAGEVILVETARPASNLDTATRDLTGTVVTSSRPVGVLSGNTRTEGALGGLAGVLTGNTMRNSAIEWLAPVPAHGTTFVYAPLFRDGIDETPELIRIVATSPGITTVSPSNGSGARSIPQGSFADFHSLELASSGITGPFSLTTDKPAQGRVIGGGYVKYPPEDSLPRTFSALYTWGPSMSELVPRNRWINSARFNLPGYPGTLRHWISIAADSGTELLLDGRAVVFDPTPVIGTRFRFARIELQSGDHFLHALSGRFTAVAAGQARGYEAFEPLATRGDDDPVTALPHLSIYLERISVSYAYPVPGVVVDSIRPDSLQTTRSEGCSETIVTIERKGPLREIGYLTITTDPASRNLAVEVDTLPEVGQRSGYRIRFAPADPAVDADGGVVVRNALDSIWYIPYTYRAQTLDVVPDPLEILGATPGIPRALPVTVTNGNLFSVSLEGARLANGTNGFTLDAGTLPQMLAPGGSHSMTITFTGAEHSTRYTDTVIVETDCRTFRLPIVAQTAPEDPAPVPLITGYDWGSRRVGTSHDTLSFISNAGNLEYEVELVEIVSDPAGAFALVDPDWRTIGTLPSGARRATGIRFTPPTTGDFSAEIVLTTTGGLRASAQLKGTGAAPALDIANVDLQSRCRGGSFDSTIVIVNSGSVEVTLFGIELPAGNTIGLTVDTSSVGFPVTLQPGAKLHIPFAASPLRIGQLSDTLLVISDLPSGRDTLLIGATVINCSGSRLTVDDHDFDSLLITVTRDGFVTLRNEGSDAVTVHSMRIIDDAEGSFRLLSTTSPFAIDAADTVRIHARFSPTTIGAKSARIEFVTDVGVIHSRLSGVGIRLHIPAFIRRDYHAVYGDTLSIAVELDSAVTLDVDSISVTVGYDAFLLAFLGVDSASSAAGWSTRGENSPDSVRLFRAAAAPLRRGTLVTMRFLVHFVLRDSCALPLQIESRHPWIEYIERPGLFTADSICGLVTRLFEWSAYRFVLHQNVPNPVLDETSISIEIPFDNSTRLSLFDPLGREVYVVVDQPLAAGAYTYTIPARTLSSGNYWYRLQSGLLVATRRLTVQ